MRVNLDKYLISDIDAIISGTYKGENLDTMALSDNQRGCIVQMLFDAYEKGARRTADCINGKYQESTKQARSKTERKAKKIPD